MQEQAPTGNKKKRAPWALRLVLWTLLSLLVMVALVPVSLYIPGVQDWVCQGLVAVLNTTSDDLSYEVGQVRFAWPLQLRVKDVNVRERQGQKLLLHVGSLRTGIDDIPLQHDCLMLGRLQLSDVEVGMDSLTASMGVKGRVSGLELRRIAVDLQRSDVRLGELTLDQPDVTLWMGPSEPDSIDESTPWQVSLGRLTVLDGRVAYHLSDVSLADALLPDSLSPYLDYRHLALTGLSLTAHDISYRADHIRAGLDYLAVRDDNSGLEVTGLATTFTLDGQRITLRDLDLRLATDDYLRGDLRLDLTVLDSVPRGKAEADLRLALDSANLVRLAAPYLPALDGTWTDVQTQLALDATLSSDTLDLRRLALCVPGWVDVRAEGYASCLYDSLQRQAALTLGGTLPCAEGLLTALVSGPDERAYRVPDDLELTLEAAQREHRLSASLDLHQARRPVATADLAYDTQTEAYQLTADLHQLNVSQFVPQLVYDGLTARLRADGRHFTVPSRTTRLEAELQVDTLYFLAADGQRDSLMGLGFTASMLGGNYVADVRADLPTVKLDTHLEGRYLSDTLSAHGHINILEADLAHLPYLAPRPDLGHLSFTSRLDASYDWADLAHLDFLIGQLTYDDLTQHHAFRDIHLALDSRPGRLDADVRGGDARLTLQTDHGIAHLPEALDTLMAEVSRQRASLRPDFDALQRSLPRIGLDFRMAHDNPFYQALEDRTGLRFERAELMVDNGRWMDVRGMVAGLHSADGGLDFDTLSVALHPAGPNDTYHYGLHALHLGLDPSRTYDIHAGGELMPDSLTAHLSYVNGKYLTLYDVSTSLAFADDTLTLHFEQGPTLYEQPFRVNPDNYLRLMKYKDLTLQKPETRARMLLEGPHDVKVSLYTRPMPGVDVGNQLLLLVRNLDLAYATRLMEWEGDMGGRYNLTASLDIFPDSLTAHLRSGARSFHMGDYRADTLSFTGQGVMAHGRRDLTAALTIDAVDKLRAEAHLADSLNVRADIAELPIALLGSYLPQGMQLFGDASGRFTMRGLDMDHARLDAALAFHDAGLDYADLDARLRFGADTLRMERGKLRLRDFPITAVGDHPITLAGTVDLSRDLTNPDIQLQVRGTDVQLIRNRRLTQPGQYVYGTLPLTLNAKLQGTPSRLSLTGRLNLLAGTDLHYFMQDDPLATSSRVDQLVEFVNFHEVDRQISSGKMRRQRTQARQDEGMTVDLKIEMDPSAKVAAHLAGADHNRVDITGGASLNLRQDAEGRMVMNGTYDMRDGLVDYKLPILPMVKTFRLDPRSRLTWADSDPSSPDIDLLATEEVRSTVNDAAGSRVVTFLVSIHIRGTLDALTLTFDCASPDDGSIASELASLSDDERSKAALMLLIAQTYIGPGNSSSMGLGTANAALTSMLNREMDSMLGNMRHTSIDLGIDTYNTDAGSMRTNYSVKVSQNFFNDRFRATIGGEVSSGFDDGGRPAGARLGDMSLEWLIKRDGSHYLKLFRTTNYESVLEGELIETGISYVQERSAYRLRQLFVPTSRKRQAQIQDMLRRLQQDQDRPAAADDAVPAPAPAPTPTDTIAP